jgi:hypothetical protein
MARIRQRYRPTADLEITNLSHRDDTILKQLTMENSLLAWVYKSGDGHTREWVSLEPEYVLDERYLTVVSESAKVSLTMRR